MKTPILIKNFLNTINQNFRFSKKNLFIIFISSWLGTLLFLWCFTDPSTQSAETIQWSPPLNWQRIEIKIRSLYQFKTGDKVIVLDESGGIIFDQAYYWQILSSNNDDMNELPDQAVRASTTKATLYIHKALSKAQTMNMIKNQKAYLLIPYQKDLTAFQLQPSNSKNEKGSNYEMLY